MHSENASMSIFKKMWAYENPKFQWFTFLEQVEILKHNAVFRIYLKKYLLLLKEAPAMFPNTVFLFLNNFLIRRPKSWDLKAWILIW